MKIRYMIMFLIAGVMAYYSDYFWADPSGCTFRYSCNDLLNFGWFLIIGAVILAFISVLCLVLDQNEREAGSKSTGDALYDVINGIGDEDEQDY